MRGVDVCDQLLGTYSTLPKTHKWWHRIVFFLFDMSLMNSWSLHCSNARAVNVAELTNSGFQLAMAEELTSSWKGRMRCMSLWSPNIALNSCPTLPNCEEGLSSLQKENSHHVRQIQWLIYVCAVVLWEPFPCEALNIEEEILIITVGPFFIFYQLAFRFQSDVLECKFSGFVRRSYICVVNVGLITLVLNVSCKNSSH